MKIGLFFNDAGFENLDLSLPAQGNNGVGGTQYCFLLLAYALVKYTNNEIVFYHFNENTLPYGVKSVRITAREEIINQACNDKVDILIFKSEGVNEFVRELKKTNLHAIVWAHNYLFSEELYEYQVNKSISRVVFVGHEMYDRYIDHPIIKKSVYIYNMFDSSFFECRKLPVIPTVTYTGSLVPAKGFHILADVWKKILKEVPDAQLYVIGNGKLYDRNANLGSYGIAQETYENRFMPRLTSNGELLESVHFLGTLGKEKNEIYRNTTVGVMNPSGKTETFGLSAVEMSACGIPVVTKRANGLFDTVINGKTGYLIKSKRALKKKIVLLLKDKRLNQHMGISGKRYVEASFAPERIVNDWIILFDDVLSDRKCNCINPTRHYTNNLKWLRIFNRSIQRTGIRTKPIINIECYIKKKVRRK